MNDQVRVALITGGARRVGRAVGLRLVDAGFDLAFTYLNSREDAQSLVEEVKNRGRRAVGISADLTDPEKSSGIIFEKFSAEFSRLDVLMNNASVFELSPLEKVNAAQMRGLWAVHAESPMMLCQRFEAMLRASRGHVINMVDLLAEKPWPEYLAYCASKAALWNITLGLARALAPEVTVNGIAPGVVEWAKDFSQAQREQYLKRVPLARAGTPQDVAEAVLYFATGGSYVTGQILRLDGGKSLT